MPMGSGTLSRGMEVRSRLLTVEMRKSAYLKKPSSAKLTAMEEIRAALALCVPRCFSM